MAGIGSGRKPVWALLVVALSIGCRARTVSSAVLDVEDSTEAFEAPALRGLIGHYGFLTDYSAMGEEEARKRIRTMAVDYGIKEFQFYDWFADYSTPMRGECWKDAFFGSRDICASTIVTFIDEIHNQGGRAWAYVQAVGSEHEDLADAETGIKKMIGRDGMWYWHVDRFPAYFPNEPWARHMVDTWAPAISDLGFDGVHWDTLGTIAGDRQAEAVGVHEFIRATKPLLQGRGLLQTMNMVDLNWWDEDIVKDFLTFSYAEVWSPSSESLYYRAINAIDGPKPAGVLAFYPTIEMPDGWSASRTMLARWDEAKRQGLTYLVIGDGSRRLINEYFPGNTEMTDEEKAHIKASVASERH